MSVKLLTEHRLKFVSFKGGSTGSSEMPYCWKSYVAAQWLRADAYDMPTQEREKFSLRKKGKNSDKYHKSSFSCMQCVGSCSSSLKLFFSMQIHEKETQLGNYVFCAKSAFVRQSHRLLPES